MNSQRPVICLSEVLAFSAYNKTCVVKCSKHILVCSVIFQGLIKIRGDKCWRELTCMDYHYEVCSCPDY